MGPARIHSTPALSRRKNQHGRNHRNDGGWKSREKSQGNVSQGNNSESAFFHSPDYHSPDFALNKVISRAGGLKILAKTPDSDGLQCKERGDTDLCSSFFVIFVFFCGKSPFGCGLPRCVMAGPDNFFTRPLTKIRAYD
jgi:hypothetical protein